MGTCGQRVTLVSSFRLTMLVGAIFMGTCGQRVTLVSSFRLTMLVGAIFMGLICEFGAFA